MRNTGIAPSPVTSRDGTVEVLAGLLAELDAATESGVFYDRVCRAVCTLTTMRRAAVLLYDHAYRTVVPMGSHGLDPELVGQIEGTLEETPLAQMALEQDRVVEVSGDLTPYLPDRYAELAEGTTITCTPIAAARRWLGVILADRGGEEFALDDGERETMMTLGRLAALTASVEHSTEQREGRRRLAERVELTRELHESAIQRLFGVALALGSDDGLPAAERRRCQEELRAVVGDLRRALTRPVARSRSVDRTSLAEALGRLRARRAELRVVWEEGTEVPPELEPLAQSVLSEALRNADRHAEATEIEVRVSADGETFTLAVENDGADGNRATGGGGLGLRLAVLEALHHEGLVEFGAAPGGRWRVRLLVPVVTQ